MMLQNKESNKNKFREKIIKLILIRPRKSKREPSSLKPIHLAFILEKKVTFVFGYQNFSMLSFNLKLHLK